MEDKFTMGTGQAHELAMAFGRNGWTNADVKRISEGDMLARLLPIIRGQAEITSSKFPSLATAAGLVPSGYTIVEDVAPTLRSAVDLKAVSFLEPEDGGYVNGETMRQRAVVKKANLGLADLKVALDDQAKISVEEGVHYIVFSGTLLRNPGGNLCVAFLGRFGVGWGLGFGRVASGWGVNDRLARCK